LEGDIMMTHAERADWLIERRGGIFSSDVYRIFGVGFDGEKGPENVYAEKTAPTQEKSPPNERMRLGTALEPYITSRFAEQTGIKVIDAPRLIWNPDVEWQGASLDRVTADEQAIVELKALFNYPDPLEWGEPGGNQIPEKYTLQVQHQMGVAGIKFTFVAAYIVGNHLRIYQVPFDAELYGMITEVEGDFWGRVQEKRGMADWRHPLISDVMLRTMKIATNKRVVLDQKAAALADEYEELGRIQNEADERRKELKGQLLAMLGDAEVGLLPDGRMPRQKLINRASYTVKESSYCDFRIMKPKKGNK
jgi:putative phage-type endonuclease